MTSGLRDELVALTCDLIRFPSTADRPDQLAAVMEYAAGYLATIPGLHIHRSEAEGKPALVATLHPTRAPALMLNAHLDVVTARPAQFTPEVRDGRIYGRASQDMKGSAAVLLRLLKDLAAQELRPDLGVQLVSDEEIGGMQGTGRLLDEGWRCDLFIALEPTDMQICYAQKGGLWLEVLLTGTPVHASRPWAGRNPILALGAGLERLARRFPPPVREEWVTTVTPTILETGVGSRNQLPPDVRLTLDIRWTAADPPESIIAALHECFPDGEVIVRTPVPPLNTDPAAPPVQRLAAAAAQVRGQPTAFFREHFASDARFYSVAGIPAVCFGPVGAGLHSDEEWVEIDSLVQLYSVLRTLVDAGGGEA